MMTALCYKYILIHPARFYVSEVVHGCTEYLLYIIILLGKMVLTWMLFM